MLKQFSRNFSIVRGRSQVVSPSLFEAQETMAPVSREPRQDNCLRLLSYNIQVGINSHSYRHYVTRGWQHFLPHPHKTSNLGRIASILSHYDIVALQEVDGGSIRTNHMNQVQYLAENAGFDYWYQQLNRNLGKVAQHSNGVLSRLKPKVIEDHKLPGLLPGRGAIVLRFGDDAAPLLLVMLHLSLGVLARTSQLAYVKELISDYDHVIVMGDMNTGADRILKLSPLRDMGLQAPEGVHHTYPSWRPIYGFDQILVSPSLKIKHTEVLRCTVSDHLPLAMEVELPSQLEVYH